MYTYIYTAYEMLKLNVYKIEVIVYEGNTGMSKIPWKKGLFKNLELLVLDISGIFLSTNQL